MTLWIHLTYNIGTFDTLFSLLLPTLATMNWQSDWTKLLGCSSLGHRVSKFNDVDLLDLVSNYYFIMLWPSRQKQVWVPLLSDILMLTYDEKLKVVNSPTMKHPFKTSIAVPTNKVLTCDKYDTPVNCPRPWATVAGKESSSKTKELFLTYHPYFSGLSTSVRGSACCNFHWLGVPEQALGGIPL